MDAIVALDLPGTLQRLSEYEAELERVEKNPAQTRVAARLKLLIGITYDHLEGLDTKKGPTVSARGFSGRRS